MKRMDGDGNADVCSKFDRAGGHTTKISIDLDCNKKTDLRLEPKLEAGTNLAVAKVTATRKGSYRSALLSR